MRPHARTTSLTMMFAELMPPIMPARSSIATAKSGVIVCYSLRDAVTKAPAEDHTTTLQGSWLGRLCTTTHHEEHAHHRLRRRADRSQGKLQARDEVPRARLHLV